MYVRLGRKAFVGRGRVIVGCGRCGRCCCDGGGSDGFSLLLVSLNLILLLLLYIYSNVVVGSFQARENLKSDKTFLGMLITASLAVATVVPSERLWRRALP